MHRILHGLAVVAILTLVAEEATAQHHHPYRGPYRGGITEWSPYGPVYNPGTSPEYQAFVRNPLGYQQKLMQQELQYEQKLMQQQAKEMQQYQKRMQQQAKAYSEWARKNPEQAAALEKQQLAAMKRSMGYTTKRKKTTTIKPETLHPTRPKTTTEAPKAEAAKPGTTLEAGPATEGASASPATDPKPATPPNQP